jgi:hypothetical protein
MAAAPKPEADKAIKNTPTKRSIEPKFNIWFFSRLVERKGLIVCFLMNQAFPKNSFTS